MIEQEVVGQFQIQIPEYSGVFGSIPIWPGYRTVTALIDLVDYVY